MNATTIKLRPTVRGNHVVVDFFVGQTIGSLGNAGHLIMGREEWALFAKALGRGAHETEGLEVLLDVG